MTWSAITAEERSTLAGEPDRLRRTMWFVALLTKHLGGGTAVYAQPILVGGGAVEFYTTGGYATQDVDLVVFDPQPVEAVLAASGFIKVDRYWHAADCDLLVELPGKTLTHAPGAYERVVAVTTSLGVAHVIGLEDILISRLYAGISENRRNDLKWAREMALLHCARLDWQALEQLASSNGPAVVAAVQHLRQELG